MSDTPAPTENGDDGTPVPDLKISEVLELLRRIGDIARHATGTRNLDWTPRGVLKQFHLVIRANMRLREKLEELERNLRKQKEIGRASRIAMNEALSFFTDEAAKFALSPEDRERINEHVSSTRATIFPEAESSTAAASSADSSAEGSAAVGPRDDEDRITREIFLEMESSSIRLDE